MRDDYYGPLLGHCAHLAKEQMRARMERFDMTPAQTHVLLYLHENGATTQTTLAEQMRVKAPTANGILDRMVDKGLVERSISGSDARRRIITITEKGLALQEQSHREFQKVEAVIRRGLTAEEEKTFCALLERITQNLEEDQTIC